ncbi:hypothetical protein [Micromonospora sp. HM5-17]|uniref:hypothetical protein n=1 Tax=Micromonospora sp. HM5-17 TaxID=2487710 RepID=UPI0011CE9C3A|nr:hypothetical protein [Micromonospora sp. HM5-17]
MAEEEKRRSEAVDLDRLGRGLALISTTILDPPGELGRDVAVRARRGWWMVPVAGVAVLVAVVLVGVSVGWWPFQQRTPDGQTGSRTAEGSVACSRLIAIGRITAVRPAGVGELQVSIMVGESLKPADASGSVTVTVDDPAAHVGAPAWPVGERVLVQEFSNGDPTPGFFGAEIDRLRPILHAAVPRAAGMRCGPG